jgi:hypothetical protein
VSRILDVAESDMALLIAIASTHTPNIHELINLDF